MYVCVRTCVYVRLCAFVCVFVRVCACVSVFVVVCMFVFERVFMRVLVLACCLCVIECVRA